MGLKAIPRPFYMYLISRIRVDISIIIGVVHSITRSFARSFSHYFCSHFFLSYTLEIVIRGVNFQICWKKTTNFVVAIVFFGIFTKYELCHQYWTWNIQQFGWQVTSSEGTITNSTFFFCLDWLSFKFFFAANLLRISIF